MASNVFSHQNKADEFLLDLERMNEFMDGIETLFELEKHEQLGHEGLMCLGNLVTTASSEVCN